MKDRIDSRRDEFDHLLAGLVDALDREHYPAGLMDSMRETLFPPGALRTLPLLLQSGKSRIDGDCELAAAEVVFRGFLLIAELGEPRQNRIGTGLATSLAKKYTEAHLLLTADTLLTWAMELAAAHGTAGGLRLAAGLAGGFGAEGALGELEAKEDLIETLAGINPFYMLAGDMTGSVSERGDTLEKAAALAWLAELQSWFGGSGELKNRIGEMESSIDSASPYYSLVEYIRRNG